MKLISPFRILRFFSLFSRHRLHKTYQLIYVDKHAWNAVRSFWYVQPSHRAQWYTRRINAMCTARFLLPFVNKVKSIWVLYMTKWKLLFGSAANTNTNTNTNPRTQTERNGKLWTHAIFLIHMNLTDPHRFYVAVKRVTADIKLLLLVPSARSCCSAREHNK